MTVSKWSRASIPAYTETDPSDGSLNPASYAASKAVDMAGDADYYLRSAGQVVTPDRKEAVANLVCELVFAVQQEQFGTTSLQSGTAHLSYRAVKSAIAVSPIPFTNPDAAAWAEWQRWIVAVASASIETGYSLWAYGPRPGAGAFLASLAAAQTTGNPEDLTRLRHIHRDRPAQDEATVRRNTGRLISFLEAVDRGEMDVHDLPDDVRIRLAQLQQELPGGDD